MAADPKGCDYRAKLKPSVHDLASDRRIMEDRRLWMGSVAGGLFVANLR